mgnify:CR=1 FL=1
MSTFLSLIGIICMILAVGTIDGPTLETSGNNFVLCFVFAIVGIMSMFLALINQSKEYNNG